MMRVTETKIGSDGHQSIMVTDVEPEINTHGLWNGGHVYSFHIDHIKQKTELYDYRYINGVPHGFDKCLKVWKDDIFSVVECVRCVEQMKEQKDE